MRTKKYYPFYIWVATLIPAPILLQIMEVYFFNHPWGIADDFWFSVKIYWLVSFYLSLPGLTIYCLFYYELRNKLPSSTTLKWVMNIIGIIGIIISFIMIGGLEFDLIVSYSISLILASLFIKIQKK